MYRVVAIMSSACALAACSSNAQLVNLDIFKPQPTIETVQFESEPPGAEVKLPNGQTCRTPCALPLSSEGTYSATYSLTGYEPATETIAPASMGDNTTALRPNPVVVQLTAAPPPKPVRRTRHKARKKAAPKPKPKQPAPPATPQAAAPTPAPAQAVPPPASPWPPVQH
ncbi:MAG TPA: PEGA domain-containing protein [Pseudolabrys sp.]|nr:PEGA domain-containing protein [Pseudolabrys sp.]